MVLKALCRHDGQREAKKSPIADGNQIKTLVCEIELRAFGLQALSWCRVAEDVSLTEWDSPKVE